MNVGSNPDGVAYDSGRGDVFVANAGGNTVSVIADSDNKVVATVGAGGDPTAVAYDSARGTVFVTGYSAGIVSVISDSALGSGATTSTTSSTTSTSTQPIVTATGPASSSATPVASSTSSSSSLPLSYLGLVAVNAALLLALGGLVASGRKTHKTVPGRPQ